MRSFGKVALAFLYAVPSASFTLPSAQRTHVSVSEASIGRSNELMEDTITSTSNYDPTDALTEESPYSDLRVDLLKEGVEYEQSVDVIKDLDGYPLPNEYFEQKMGIANVESYTCPEKDVFRGFNSDACRVNLSPGGETAFYKRIVFKDLDHAREKLKTAPHKLTRDAKSYQVVGSFFLSKACQAMTEKTGVQIPKCYDAQIEPNFSNPLESKFSFLFEDFAPSDGWHQQWLIHDVEKCEAALSTYAKIHAYFWNGSSFWNDADAARELEAGVWESGSYVQPKFQSETQWKSVAKEWATKRTKFQKELSSLDCWDNLGQRLESVAEECGHLAHPFADDTLSQQYEKYRTFTHGDPKQANLLFRTTESKVQVGMLDFQWAGFGLAASDIAHFLTSAVHADRLVDGGEAILLQFYYDELQKYLTEYGAYTTADDAIDNFSYDTFMDQYETAVLDICRLMIAYTWSRFEEPVEKDDELGCARTMNKTSYNKSIPNVIWLISRCDEIMKSRGV